MGGSSGGWFVVADGREKVAAFPIRHFFPPHHRTSAWPELVDNGFLSFFPLCVLSTANINSAQCQLSTMNDHSHVYLGTTAFVAGILLTVGFKDLVYPALKQRLQQYQSHDDESRRRRESQMMPDSLIARPGPPAIVDGVEGCIGNTPLFRIKSLSEETGCEILGKAEVFPFIHIHIMHTRHDSDWI